VPCPTLALALALTLPVITFAGPPEGFHPLAPDQEVAQVTDWTAVTDGVWKREIRKTDGSLRTERIARGPAGLRWAAGRMALELLGLMDRQAADPTASLETQIALRRQAIRDLEGAIERLESLGGAAATVPGIDSCDFTFGASAEAVGGFSGGSGARANADASFTSTCGIVATVTASVLTTAAFGNPPRGIRLDLDDCSLTGDDVSCDINAGVGGTAPCSSEASARVSSPTLGLVFEVEDDNSSCG